MADPKAIAAMLISGKKPGDEPAPVDAATDGADVGSEPDEAAAQDMMDALNTGDAKAFASAMKAFIQIADQD